MADTYTYSEIGQRAIDRNPAAFQGLNVTPDEIGRRIIQRNPSMQALVKEGGGSAAPSAFAPKPAAAPAVSQGRQEDVAAARKYGAIIAPNTDNPSIVGEPLKVLANMPTSAWNFAKGAVDLMNPISTANKIKDVVTGFGDLQNINKGIAESNKATADSTNKLIETYKQKKAAGQDTSHLEQFFKSQGIDTSKIAVPAKAPSAFGQVVKGLPSAAYESLVPEAGRGVISAIHGGFTGNSAEVDQGLKTAQRAIVSDPVGQIAPFLLAARGGAAALDRMGVTEGAGAAFDTGVSKVASPVIRAGEAVKSGVGSFVTGGTKFGVGQATGLSPKTIETITEQPKSFSKAGQASTDRIALGQEVQSALAKRASLLEDTGAGYSPIREGDATVKVSKNWLDSTIRTVTGTDIKSGKITASGESMIRDAGDVRALQHVYDLWKPVFQRGNMTANEFLNFRSDLAKLSKFERQIGKSQPVESATKIMRGQFNEAYRPQLEGLDALDAEFSKQTGELKTLSKGLVDKNGQLTDAGLSKIANLSKVKPNLAAQLEEIAPGIAKRVKVVQAIEDIQHASGIKVGTYGRAALTGGAFFLGGPVQAVITAILTSPEMAVPILRSYGLLKNSAAVQGVMRALKSAATQVNNLPNELPPVLKKEVNAENFPVGLTIKDVSKKPSAFSPKGKGVAATPETASSLFRGGGEGAMPKGMTAADVLNYERTQLGNADVKPVAGIDLKKIKSDNLQWLTTTKKAAANYGAVENIKGNFRVIAKDSEGGMLVEKLPEASTETQLYHTTTGRAASQIRKQGFKVDIRPEDQIGRAFGDGTYFSTTKEEAQIWSEFVTNKNNGKIIDLKANLNIYDPKTRAPSTYWQRLGKEAGVKISAEDGQNIADSLMMGKDEVISAGMTMEDFTKYRDLGKEIVQKFAKKYDGAKFYEPMEDEGIVNPQVVVFNLDKVNAALKKGKTNFGR